MRRALLVAVFMLLAIPAMASEVTLETQVDRECDETTITNLADTAQIYHIQVYEAADDYTLEPGESHMFRTVANRGAWAVWTNGELVASGEFCNVYAGGGTKIAASDYQPNPDPVVDGTDEPWSSEPVEQASQLQVRGQFQPF